MKLVLLLLTFVSFFGCAAMKKQANIATAMEKYEFKFPAAKVYEGASQKFAGMMVTIKKVKDFEGVSDWVEKEGDPQVKSEKSRSRFRIVVTGNKSSWLNIFREEEYYLTSKWSGNVMSHRTQIYEYNVLENLDPAAAKAIDEAASK